MQRPKVFVTRIIPDKGLELVREFADAEVWQEELPPSHADLVRHMPGVQGLLCLLTDKIDAEVMQAAGGSLSVISNHAVGFDNVDVTAATRLGIPVGNTPGILTESTADFAFLLMMAAGRRLGMADRFVRAGRWKTWGPTLLLGADFRGATLGLVGFGRIGKAMARRAAGFDMRVVYYDPLEVEPGVEGVTRAATLDALLEQADFVSLHTPLNDATYHLIGVDALARMKPNAVLINTSRGPVVDLQALYEALRQGRIFAAALDVTDPEPLPADNPLFDLDNVIITPHMASASKTTREKMAVMAAHNLIAGLRGERLPNCVNPEVYSS